MLSRRSFSTIESVDLANLAVGVGLAVFLRALVPNEPVYLVGLIPGLIGVALLTYALFLAPPVE